MALEIVSFSAVKVSAFALRTRSASVVVSSAAVVGPNVELLKLLVVQAIEPVDAGGKKQKSSQMENSKNSKKHKCLQSLLFAL